MTLAEQIQILRKEKGLSQEELGEKLGVARQSVSKWESGTTIPELDKLIAMSKLFGVSVGSILGLEEAGEPDHELTERELKALEAIAQRLTPPAQEPKKWKKWPLVLAAVAVIGAGAFLMSRINALENQIGGLQSNLSNVQNTVSREVGSISARVREILEEQNSVTAGEGYEVTGMDLLNNKVTFALTATPREYREGMRAVFSAVGDFEAVEVPGVLGAGQTFTAELTCPLTDAITLSVGFVTEESTVTQQLGQERNLLFNTQVVVDGHLSWSMSGIGGKPYFTSLTADVWEGATGWCAPGGQEIGVAEATVRLWVGDELYWSRECGDLSQRNSEPGIEIPTEELTVAPGERILLSCRYTDSAGREDEVFLDGMQIKANGSPRQLLHDEEKDCPWE